MQDDGRTYAIIGAAMRVHRELGPGYLEITYQTALDIEFRHCAIAARREVPIEIWYRGERLGGSFRADFECYDGILVELKALPCLGVREVRQLAHYLRATRRPLGLLLNFGADSLEFQRVVPGKRTLVGPRHWQSARLHDAADSHLQAMDQADSLASAQSQAPRSPTA